MKISRAGFGLLIGALLILAGSWTAARAVSGSTPGGGGGAPGTNFTCDVNKGTCKCDGVWEGADCRAMAKNCRGGSQASHACHEDQWCICQMYKTGGPADKSGKLQTPPHERK